MVSYFPGIVHYVDGKTVYASRGRVIFRSLDGGYRWEELVVVPMSCSERLRACTRLSRRLFRANVYHLRPVWGGKLVILGFGFVFVLDLEDGTIMRMCPIIGSRPLGLCDDGRMLYYGEYRGNAERSPVHIWASDYSGKKWQPVYRFDKVRHIHGIFFDPYTNWLWVTTGDENEESGIWVTKNHFASVDAIVSGSQRVRVITLLFTEDSLYFGSDNPGEQNYLCRLSRSRSEVEEIMAVEGPIFFGCKIGRYLFFSSACEPRALNRLGQVGVWKSDGGKLWERVMTSTKDIFPMKLFQYGQIMFPSGPGQEGYLWVTPFATTDDQVTRKFAFAG